MSRDAHSPAAPQQVSATRSNWFRFIALSGPEGRRWVEDYYKSPCIPFTKEVALALQLLHNGKTDQGRSVLNNIEGVLSDLSARSISWSLLARRLYHPVLAYLQYCEGDFEEAEISLDLADAAVAEAIQGYAFLLPIADSCLDFSIQRVRVSRRQCRWLDMVLRAARVRDILEDRLPLCNLKDGRLVGFSSLSDYYHSLSLSEEDLRSLAHLLDRSQRTLYADRILEDLYALPSFVISY